MPLLLNMDLSSEKKRIFLKRHWQILCVLQESWEQRVQLFAPKHLSPIMFSFHIIRSQFVQTEYRNS